MSKKQPYTTHRGVRFSKPEPSPDQPNPLLFFALLALMLGVCYISANWNTIVKALSPVR